MTLPTALSRTTNRAALAEQLPIWTNDMQVISNALVRSGLFNVANTPRGLRPYFKRVEIASLTDTTVTYTGEELRQDDRDLFLQILHMGRMHPPGTHVQFTTYGMLVELGWTHNTSSYKRLMHSGCLQCGCRA